MESNFSNITVQTGEEFLNCFASTTFENTSQFETEIRNPQTVRIGAESAVGNVYITPSGKIIKEGKYCRQPAPHLLNELCQLSVKGSYVYHIPNTPSKKKTILAPNYFIEPIVGKIIYNYTKKYTPSFMKITSFAWNKNTSTSFIEMEKLESPSNSVKSLSDYIYFVFQIIWAIKTGQQTNKFVHYDLHPDNILCRKHQTIIQSSYELPDGNFLYTQKDFDAVIIDYGHSRCETKNSILTPRLTFKFNNISSREFIDYYEFNPYYDIFSLLYTFTNRQSMTRQFPNWVGASTNGVQFTTNLLTTFLNGNDIQNILITPTGWRPNPEKLANATFRTLTPSEMLIVIAKNIGSVPPQNVVERLNSHEIVVSDYFSKTSRCFKGVPELERMNIVYNLYTYPLKLNDSFDGITFQTLTGSIAGVRNTIALFNHTIGNNARNTGGFYNQYIHIATIKPNSNYQFRFDCCKIDLKNYFQSNFKSGVAINATFFNITSNYNPIGFFKSTEGEFISNVPIPDGYSDYYGIVGIDLEGKLKIDTINNSNKYQSVLTCGPILVWNSEQIITDSLIENNPILFQCDLNNDNVPPMNCGNIIPGQLTHASNPNPRTALIIHNNGYVSFVIIEGRDQRGDGMDLAQLAQFCAFNDGKFAINLDGGRSSQMYYKKPNSKLIYGENPNHDNAYNIGSIISYVKI